MSAAKKAPESLAHRPAAWWRGWLVVAALLSLLFVPARAAEDDDEEKIPPLPKDVADIARKYSGVTEWQGFFDASRTGSAANNGPKYALSRHSDARASGHFTLKLASDGAEAKRGEFQWGGINTVQSGESTGSEFDEWSERDDIYGTSTEWRSELGGTVPLFAVKFDINLLKQNGNVHMGFTPDDRRLKKTKTGHAVTYLSSDNGKPRHGTEIINEESRADLLTPEIRSGFPIDREYALREWAVVRNGPGVLTFVYGRTDPSHNDKDMTYTYRSRIILFPVYDDLEVEVTIEGYAKWRPEGSIKKPFEPGNNLVARATLTSKTGKGKELPMVKRFRFELLDTSREPGVCLNWPLDAKDQDYDLRLAAMTGRATNEPGQKLYVTEPHRDDEGLPYAEARINSYDFGGRASLLAVCELADGREILGVMKSEGGETGVILLPRRFSGDWIARQWRDDRHVVEPAARADDENSPVGDGTKGDGLTLYEEYRGWVEDGDHIEGDPQTKDFFIQLKKAGVALPGVAKFQKLTGLKVHYKFTEREFPGSRIINANRDLGPNVTDQHGVVIKVRADRAGVSDAVGGPGNPKMISAVLLMSNIAAVSADYAAVTVAHELGHCVNLWHHGDTDHKVVWVAENDKLYELSPGRAGAQEISVVNEEFEDLTPTVIDMALDAQALEPPGNYYKPRMAVDQGQHSGVEDCIMRYDDAQTYVYRDRTDFRVWLFNEPVGHGLCTKAEGTGVNDEHRPAAKLPLPSRYGRTFAGRGDCRHQIHVTDADTSPWRYKDPRKPGPRPTHKP